MIGSDTERAEQAHALTREIQQLEADEQRHASVAAVAAQVAGGEVESLGYQPPERDPYRDVGEVYGDLPPKLMPSRDQVAQMYRAVNDRTNMRTVVSEPTEHLRAAVTLADTGTPAESLSPPAPREPRRLSTARRT